MDSIDDKYWDDYENYGRLGRDAEVGAYLG